MCRNYILPLMLARGRELLNDAHRGLRLARELRAFTTAEFAEVEKIHWAPARDEFGHQRCFTSVHFQRRFESMIRSELESKVLPLLDRASRRMDGPLNGEALEELTAGPKEADASESRLKEHNRPGAESSSSHGGRARDRRAEVDAFLLKCTQETSFKATRAHIWQAVGHASARQFQYWQASNAKATAQDDPNFRRILAMHPADFESLLKKKGII